MIGDIVIFHLDGYTRGQIQDRANQLGKCVNLFSNDLPAMVVQEWSYGCVNLQVFADGDLPPFWVTSVSEGTAERNFTRKF